MQDRSGEIFQNALNQVRAGPGCVEGDSYFKSTVDLFNYQKMLGFEHPPPDEDEEVPVPQP